ncbi:DUF7312 domain-containing protein [Haloglomus halophilum]|uniref:DUF7312 domain-containing protein n=1 Tax=Haloglomus halophilum TaxID=2962672 RepID=UPI0020C9509F|nr:hypothetical protein [Haloglomus halophilum]
MDETDDPRDGPTDESGHRKYAAEPREPAAGSREPGEDPRYDDETVASTVRDVEGIEYEQSGNVAGASPGADLGPVEPETPTLEGALFVLLGVVLTLVVLAQLVGF